MVGITKSEKDTIQAGYELGLRLEAGDAVLYTGEMGAGKTYFTKGIGKALGIQTEITSPTFAIVNEYTGRLPIFHFDLFRIDNYDDLYAIGFFDYPTRGGVVVIEWSENIYGIEQEFLRVFKVNIKKISDTEREIDIRSMNANIGY